MEYFYNTDLIYDNFDSGNSLFIKYWYSQYVTSLYSVSPIPGWKEGITGSIASTYNIAINKYSENIEDAINVIKFLTSYDYQKNSLINEEIFTARHSMYDDEEVCEIADCSLFKKIIPFNVIETVDEITDVDVYFKKFKEYVLSYVTSNSTLEETLKNIEDMTKFYQISISTEDSYYGLVLFIFYSIMSTIMVSSLVFLFIKKYSQHFNLFPKRFWIISVIGCLLILNSILTIYGKVSVMKCHLRAILLSLGIILNIIPIFYKLISNFPEQNDFSYWINNHKYYFLLTIMGICLGLNSLSGFSSYHITNIKLEKGESFQICQMINPLGKVILILTGFYEFFILLTMLILIFLEWSIEETIFEIKFFLSTTFMNVLLRILYYLLTSLNINNYIGRAIIMSSNILILALSNFILFYGIIIISIFINPSDEESFIIEIIKNNANFNVATASYPVNSNNSINDNTNFSINTDRKSIISNKFYNYHYRNRINSTSSRGTPSNIPNNNIHNNITKINNNTSLNSLHLNANNITKSESKASYNTLSKSESNNLNNITKSESDNFTK